MSKNLWIRLGATLHLTDQEVEDVLGAEYDADRMAEIVKQVVAESRLTLDGETYVPETAIEDFNDRYGTNYELREPECCL